MIFSVWEAHSTWVSVGDRCEDTFGTGVSFYIYLHHGIHIDDLNLWPITRCGDKPSPLKPLSLEARNLVAYWLEIRAFSLGFMYNCLGQILSLYQWRAQTIELMYREPQRLRHIVITAFKNPDLGLTSRGWYLFHVYQKGKRSLDIIFPQRYLSQGQYLKLHT